MMLQAATGVLTGSQRPTQQKQDLADSENELSTVAFMSKGELLRFIAVLSKEKSKMKEEEIRLREALSASNKQVSHYQDLYLEAIDRNRKPRTIESIFLKIAG